VFLYRGSQFYWWRKPEYPEKAIDRPVVAFSSDKYIFSNADYDDNCFSMNYSIVTTFMTHYEKEKKDVYVFAKCHHKLLSSFLFYCVI
jgi:hypothetical protein